MTANVALSRRRLIAGAIASVASTWAGAAPASDDGEASGAGGDFRSDATLLARAYGSLHPGLYRYNTPEAMAARFDALHTELSQPRTRAEAYVAFARVTAAVRCGHSYPNFYNQSRRLRTALFTAKDRLPFHFRWLGHRMIVTRNLSVGTALEPGTDVLALDGTPSASILAALMPLARADGSNDGKRRRILEVSGIDRYEAFDLYLPMLMPTLFAAGEVAIDVRDPSGRQRRVVVGLISAEQRASLHPSPIDKPADAPLWTLDDVAGVARLSMPTWGVYNGTWDWRGWLERSLDDVVSSGSRALLIDLRGNEGGLDCGNPILSRLTTRDIVTPAAARRVRYRKVPPDLAAHVDTWDDSFRDWGEQAVGPDADGFYDLTRWSDDDHGNAVIRAEGKPFRGRVAVLVDAVNSSATFQFAQTMQDRHLGTLVGETTGGNRRGINGGAFLFLRLPASGIEVDIPLIGSFPSTPQPDAGITPDIEVEDTAEDLASGVDRCMETALRALR